MIKASDKTEFEAMLHSVNEMKKTATDLNRPYVDKKILKFAKDAISECKEVREYLVDQIEKNIDIWLNLKEIHIKGSEFSIKANALYVTGIGEFEIVFKVTDIRYVTKVWGYTSVDYISIERDGIEIVDVRFYKDGDVKIYDTFESSNGVQDLSRLYTSRGWSAIHNRALFTQKYTKALWESAKSALESRMARFKGEAAQAEEAKAKVNKVGEYQKVTTI